MASPTPRPAAHYRRRILTLGALATGVLYVIGAPIFNRRIEDDLERRVPAELADAGFGVVTASFSGQDGTITCDAPLDDPEGARAAAFDVRGVRDVELDRSCRVNTAPPPSEAESTEDAAVDDSATNGDDTVDAGTDADAGEASEEDADGTVATTVDLATIRDVVAANPDLAFLSVLLADVAIGGTDGPVTLFAPDNDAFDAVPADVLGRLQSDPELLSRVLSHHLVDGVIRSDELRTGELVAHDGTAIEVDVADGVTVGGAPVIETDIVASNGIVHVVGALLLPPDLAMSGEIEPAAATAVFDGTTIVLSGVVASEVERLAVVDAAVAAVGVGALDDQLVVDPDTGVGADLAGQIATLIAALPGGLTSGEVGFDGEELFARGTAPNEDAAAAFVASASAAGVTAIVETAATPAATDADAAVLEAALNEFVTENPIQFEPSSAVLSPSAVAVLDRIARDAQRLSGVAITVEGHTDSDGAAAANLQLSQARADAVRAELIARGLAEDAVDAIGLGSERPILVDGAEDKAASRRVEFRVVAG